MKSFCVTFEQRMVLKAKWALNWLLKGLKDCQGPCVWSFCVRVAKNYFENIFLFCVCRPTHLQLCLLLYLPFVVPTLPTEIWLW